MRVLAWPKSENRHTNPYNYLFYSALEQRGVEVDEFRFGRLLGKRYDYLHLHWPENAVNEKNVGRGLWELAKFSLMLLTAGLRGT